MAIAAAAMIATGFCTSARRPMHNGPRWKPRPGCFSTDGACRTAAGVLQGLAGLELRPIRRLDGHRFGGERLWGGRRLALDDRAGAEEAGTDFYALLKRVRDQPEKHLEHATAKRRVG